MEVLPDLTKPTVIILTEAPGLAPEEVETRVTQPIESALMGVAGLTRLRSNSDVSLSLVYAEFGWDTDIYKARMLVQERLQGVREQLPEGVQPFMTPVASLMGEILLVGVRSTIKDGEPGYLPPRDVRSLADWTIKRRLQSISGIAEILNMGGGVKQIEIQPDPYRMQANGVSFEELEHAAQEAASTTTGGFINTGPTEIMVRNLAMTVAARTTSRAPSIKKVNDRPILISRCGECGLGHRADARRRDRQPERRKSRRPTASSCPSPKSPGFDTRALTEQIKQALEELKTTLSRRRRDHAALPAEGLHRPRHRQSHGGHPRRRDHGHDRPLPLPAEFPHHLHHAHGDAALLRHHHAGLQMVRHLGELDDARRARRRHRHGRR